MEGVLALPLNQLDIGINQRVISLPSKASVLDAMKLMHEQGVGSIAIIDTEGSLLSVCAKLSSMVQMGIVNGCVPQAVSATDIGRLVATSPDKSVLSVSLSHFISLIKASCTLELSHGQDFIFDAAPTGIHRRRRSISRIQRHSTGTTWPCYSATASKYVQRSP